MDFKKVRAQSDTEALKIRYSNQHIYEKNKPKENISSLIYNTAERIRYEFIGSKK